jgi:hypothetical protein
MLFTVTTKPYAAPQPRGDDQHTFLQRFGGGQQTTGLLTAGTLTLGWNAGGLGYRIDVERQAGLGAPDLARFVGGLRVAP